MGKDNKENKRLAENGFANSQHNKHRSFGTSGAPVPKDSDPLTLIWLSWRVLITLSGTACIAAPPPAGKKGLLCSPAQIALRLPDVDVVEAVGGPALRKWSLDPGGPGDWGLVPLQCLVC